MIMAILLGVSVALNAAGAYVIFRTVRKLFQFDDLFELLQHDVETNIKYLEKTLESPLMMNTPEIVDVHKNMHTMGVRLVEYVNRFNELKGTEIVASKKLPRPVVA